MKLTAGEVAAATGGILSGNPDSEIHAVCTDSRKITPHSLFIPWVGERFNGHDFIVPALQFGAAGCLYAAAFAGRINDIRQNLSPELFYIQVPDTRLALKALAAYYRSQFSVPFIQITGSVGKTTSKDMISAALGRKLRVWKTPENYNNDVGTPLTLLAMPSDTQAAVIETGMNHAGEIHYLGEMVCPDIAVITNIGDAHIEFLGSRENILKAKCEILDALHPDGLLILNGDDALLDTIQTPFRVIRCGTSPHCQIQVTDVADHGVEGITCTVTGLHGQYTLNIPAPGDHMIYSASMAVAVCEELGLSAEEIMQGIASYVPTGSRMRVLRLPEKRVILDDCYNANPQSVAAALEVLAKTECDRRVAVLGDMGELGNLTDQAHYNMGALAAMLGMDYVIAIGQSAVRIMEGAAQNGCSVLHFPTKEAALPELRAQLEPGTAMLIKASHAMGFVDLVRQLQGAYL